MDKVRIIQNGLRGAAITIMQSLCYTSTRLPNNYDLYTNALANKVMGYESCNSSINDFGVPCLGGLVGYSFQLHHQQLASYLFLYPTRTRGQYLKLNLFSMSNTHNWDHSYDFDFCSTRLCYVATFTSQLR